MSIFKNVKLKLSLGLGILLFGISSIFGFQVSGENFDANFKIHHGQLLKTEALLLPKA